MGIQKGASKNPTPNQKTRLFFHQKSIFILSCFFRQKRSCLFEQYSIKDLSVILRGGKTFDEKREREREIEGVRERESERERKRKRERERGRETDR